MRLSLLIFSNLFVLSDRQLVSPSGGSSGAWRLRPETRNRNAPEDLQMSLESAKILINQTKKVKLSLKLTLSSSWSGAAPCSSSFSGEDPSRSYWRSRTVSDKLVSRWTLINMTSVWLLTRVHEQYLTRCVKAEEAEERKQASPLI